MVPAESGRRREARGAGPDAAAASGSIAGLIDVARESAARRLGDDDMKAAARAAMLAGIDASAAHRILRGITEAPASRTAVVELIGRCERANAVPRRAMVRWLLLNAVLVSLNDLPALPVPPSVSALFCREFAFVATADASDKSFDPSRAAFVDITKKATLRRFPAGQFDWDVSGVSRRSLLHIEWQAMPRVAVFIAARMRGLQPVFFSHLNPHRSNASLREDEALRSYFRMAAAMRQQPGIIGFAACSWFRSPDTHAVSPHLAWLSDVFLSNGGLVVRAGRADPDCGVLYRSATRRALFAAGRFVPTEGLVLWPRRAMLAWADAHPELAA